MIHIRNGCPSANWVSIYISAHLWHMDVLRFVLFLPNCVMLSKSVTQSFFTLIKYIFHSDIQMKTKCDLSKTVSQRNNRSPPQYPLLKWLLALCLTLQPQVLITLSSPRRICRLPSAAYLLCCSLTIALLHSAHAITQVPELYYNWNINAGFLKEIEH